PLQVRRGKCIRIMKVQRTDYGTFLPSGGFYPKWGSETEKHNIQTRIANERYLRTRQEVELLLSGFFREMFLKRPDNILEFAADYFTDPGLPNKIHMQLIEDKKAA
uniref:Regulatory subunit of type II PKA R-subunit domain containing 1 n=1 Tax=Urocitellus parryii TaxID=9999 RepID=A0A8D2H3U9_UROPR